jgi:hypothetical protein
MVLSLIGTGLMAVQAQVADANAKINVMVSKTAIQTPHKAHANTEPFTVLTPVHPVQQPLLAATTPTTTIVDAVMPAAKPVETVLTARGILSIDGLKARRAEVYAIDARAKAPFTQRYFGTLTAEAAQLRLPAGRYVLKYLSDLDHSPGIEQTVDIMLGDVTAVTLGEIVVANLKQRQILAFQSDAAATSMMELGYAGSFGEGRQALQVPAGRYRLKFFSDHPYTPGITLDGVNVTAGQQTVVLLGSISMDEVGEQRYMVVRQGTQFEARSPHTSQGFAGWLTAGQSQLELPPGRYELRLAYGQPPLDNIEIQPNHNVIVR